MKITLFDYNSTTDKFDVPKQEWVCDKLEIDAVGNIRIDGKHIGYVSESYAVFTILEDGTTSTGKLVVE